jgi:hypothetical protein
MTQQKKRHIFSISHESEIDDCTYTGTFTSKKLSVKDRMQISTARTRLNGGYHHDPEQPGVGVDATTDSVNYMLAQLEVSLVDTPSWWNLTEIGDLELVTKVFTEVATFENSFRNRGRDDQRGSQEGGQTSGPEAHASRAVKSVVADEVSASLEP